jgi:nucleotide-binding universal stress UspA family protein
LPPTRRQEPELAWSDIAQESLYHKAARRLQRAIPQESSLWCTKVMTSIQEGQPYREILSYAEEQEIDLICLGAHGANFGTKTLFGSNVDRVLRQAGCPVLVARPRRTGH